MKNVSLKTQLIIVIGGGAIVAIIVLVGYINSVIKRQIESDQGILLRSTADRMAAQLATDINSRSDEILFLSKQDRVSDISFPLIGKQRIFENMRKSYPFYAWIGMADAGGNILVGTDGLLVGKNVAKRDWFLKGKQSLYFGNAHDAFLLAKLLPKPRWDDLPLRLVDVSAPVFDKDGKFIGVVCGHLSLDWAFEARQKMLKNINMPGLDLLVLNKTNDVLMGSPSLPSLKENLSGLSVLAGKNNNADATGVVVWPDSHSYLTSVVHDNGFGNYRGMGWKVVARRPDAVAFSSIRQLLFSVVLAAAVMVVLFITFILLILRRQLYPLSSLALAASSINETTNSIVLPEVHTNNEFSQLAHYLANIFNRLNSANGVLRLADRIIENSGQGILVTDKNGVIIRVNESFKRITRYADDEVIGKKPSILKSGIQSPAFYAGLWETVLNTGSWRGEIWNKTKDGAIYPEWLTINTLKDNGGDVSNFIAIFDDITEKKNVEQKLLRLANFDALTELPNRNYMYKRATDILDDNEGNEHAVGLIFVDLDRFKQINDLCGHTVGDKVLREVAGRFLRICSDSILLSRWGGDEFVVIADFASRNKLIKIAESLMASLQKPIVLDGEIYHVTASSGISICPDDGNTIEQLLKCADSAMYDAKRHGANQYRFFDPDKNKEIVETLLVENEMRQAVAHGFYGFSVVYQPQFDIDTEEIVGAEALLRWTNSKGVLVPPSIFIPICENCGLIQKIGEWVIHKVALDYRKIDLISLAPFQISINCSAKQLISDTLPVFLKTECEYNNIRTSNVTIEITESALMEDEVVAATNLAKIREFGFQFSIDDFGTGFSCLNYIQKIKPFEIKIDQSFVRNMIDVTDSRNIVKFTMSLAQTLGVRVVAEGVETSEELNLLKTFGNPHIQGYLFSKPLPFDEFLCLLSGDIKGGGRGSN